VSLYGAASSERGKEGEEMTRYIIVHGTALHATQDQVVDGAKAVIASLPPGTAWLNTWSAVPDGKVFCEWEAADPDTIRSLLEASEVGDLLPIEAIYETEWVDPKWFE
jgi:hypothetical protein